MITTAFISVEFCASVLSFKLVIMFLDDSLKLENSRDLYNNYYLIIFLFQNLTVLCF